MHFNNLSNINQSIPIVLTINTAQKDKLQDCSSIALCHRGTTYAILKDIEIYYHRKEERCARQFGTTNKDHPYIKVSLF